VLRLAALARSRRSARGTAWDDLRGRIGRISASVEALWSLTQMCVTEAERTGIPSPLGSAVKLRYSELAQEIAALSLRVIGRPILGAGEFAGVRTADAVRDYLWSFQTTIAAGTSQIQRNLIAQRILGMPKSR
jgi:alkylation response protein AidB-like acyl-CoA dehydrogenase